MVQSKQGIALSCGVNSLIDSKRITEDTVRQKIRLDKVSVLEVFRTSGPSQLPAAKSWRPSLAFAMLRVNE